MHLTTLSCLPSSRASKSAYSAYAEFQQKLERYWSLRWFEQERLTRIAATVLKSDVLRLDGVPFVTRVPGLPDLPRGQRVELDIVSVDHVDLTLEARCIACWPDNHG